MRKIETLFIGVGLIAVIAVVGANLSNNNKSVKKQNISEITDTRFGNFLAAQHAIYVNDFDTAYSLSNKFSDTDFATVQGTKYLAEYLSGHMPTDANLIKNEKSIPSQYIYDAHLVKNDNWKELYERHKKDESPLAAPFRIWSGIANNYITKTLQFIDKLPTNDSWKSFVRGQIYAEQGKIDKAAENFAKVSPEFMNINDYMYVMSFYKHNNMVEDAENLKYEFTRRPGGMFMLNYDNIPDWSIYSGYKNALAFGIVQNVSHTQILMYSDLAMLMLRFAEITAPTFAKTNNVVDYYLGQFFYTNTGDYERYFSKTTPQSPFYQFVVLRGVEKGADVKNLEQALKEYPLFVPAINKLIAHYIQNGNKRAALRVINRAINDKSLDDAGRAFFLKSRAHIHFVFGDTKSAQKDIHTATKEINIDPEILSLQVKIWARENREIENAYDYAMTLVRKNPSDVFAWDTLGYVVTTREGIDAALEMLRRVGEVSESCSSLFEQLGDLYTAKGDKKAAKEAYLQAIELSDDGLVVIKKIERKIRKLK